MPRIKNIEYFRVPPRWLFVKITDEENKSGWGEATLEGHTQAVEGCLDALMQRFMDYEAKYFSAFPAPLFLGQLTCFLPLVILNIYGRAPTVWAFTAVGPC